MTTKTTSDAPSTEQAEWIKEANEAGEKIFADALSQLSLIHI